MSDSSDEDVLTSVESRETVQNGEEMSLLPEKSRLKYMKAFDLFNTWRHKTGATTYSETVILSYFIDLAKSMKPSTLWSIYSMLKATLKLKKDVHIEKYPKLLAFIKKTSSGHKPKKSKTFTAADIKRFLNEAPDSQHLGTKAVLIIGISGACRTQELTYLKTSNVEKHSETLLLFKLPDTKTNIERNFVVRDEYMEVVKKYQNLRPPKTSTDRFFLGYRKGKCINQPMGPNKIGSLPREIATFLGLTSPEQYTGHCFRRTSATLLADSGADLTTLKRHRGWKSSTVAEKSKICKDSEESYSTEHEVGIITEPLRGIQDPLANNPDRCRFCANVTKCVDAIDKPYLKNNKMTVILNDIKVEIDLKDTQKVCLDCDRKLLEMYCFVTLVKNAQDTLLNASYDTEETESLVVKIECESPTPDDNDEIDETQEGIVDLITIDETAFVKNDSFIHKKRKSDKDIKEASKPQKKRKFDVKVTCESTEVIIDIKEEPIERDDDANTDIHKATDSEDRDTGPDIRLRELDMTNVLLNEMAGDGVS